jgi:hypothetical protein
LAVRQTTRRLLSFSLRSWPHLIVNASMRDFALQGLNFIRGKLEESALLWPVS